MFKMESKANSVELGWDECDASANKVLVAENEDSFEPLHFE